MSGNDNKSTRAPRLRFPRFRELAEWKSDKLELLVSTVTPSAKLPSSC